MMQKNPVQIAYFYVANDILALEKLKSYLLPWQKQGLFLSFTDIEITSAYAQSQEVKLHLAEAQIVLLLLSPEALATPYLYTAEVQQLFQRHMQGTLRLVPVILQPSHWQATSFGKLPVIPANKQAISTWADQNAAYANVVGSLLSLIQDNSAPTVNSTGPALRPLPEGNTTPAQNFVQTMPASYMTPAATRPSDRPINSTGNIEKPQHIDPTTSRPLIVPQTVKSPDTTSKQLNPWVYGPIIPPPPPPAELTVTDVMGQLKSATVGTVKSMFFFLSALLIEVSLIVTMLTAASWLPLYIGSDASTLATMNGGIAFTIFICTIILLFLAIFFYKRGSHLSLIPWYYYFFSVMAIIIADIVGTSLSLQYFGDNPSYYGTIDWFIIFCSGIALMMVTFLRARSARAKKQDPLTATLR